VIETLLERDPQKDLSFFRPIPGAGNLMRLVRSLADPEHPPMFEMDDICHYSTSSQITLEKVALMLKKHLSANIMKRLAMRKKVLREAVQLALHSGEVAQYCELLFQAGNHDEAIAAVPAVSVSLWRELMQRKIERCPENSIAEMFLASKAYRVIDLLLLSDPAAAMVIAVGRNSIFMTYKRSFQSCRRGNRSLH
jgi:hypothetical protein